jgi:hypothetical protein
MRLSPKAALKLTARKVQPAKRASTPIEAISIRISKKSPLHMSDIMEWRANKRLAPRHPRILAPRLRGRKKFEIGTRYFHGKLPQGWVGGKRANAILAGASRG